MNAGLSDLLAENNPSPELIRAALARFGFSDPASIWSLLSRMSGDPADSEVLALIAEQVLAAAARAADPGQCLLQLDRLGEAFGCRAELFERLNDRPELLFSLFAIFGNSRALSDVLVSNPGYIDILSDVNALSRTVSLDEMRLEASSATSGLGTRDEMLDALRQMRRREYLRIGARELTGLGAFTDVVGEISDLACALVAETLSVCHEWLDFPGGAGKPGTFAVLAFGKLGARELNYSSDIDLAIVWDTVENVRQEAFHLKLAKQMVEALSQLTAHGRMYRVDMRLRPFGSSGPIGSSISTLFNYYESWSEPWERQALIKCRAIAGPPSLRARLENFLTDFAFSRPMDSSSISQILLLKDRSEEVRRASGSMSLQVKHGWGGIRDVEFTVQLLQLVAGYKYEQVRAPATLDALEALRQCQIISEQEEATLASAYEFLRQVEHRLQLVDEQPLQMLPEDGPGLRRLAESLGYRDDQSSAPDQFLQEYQSITASVRAIHERLFKDFFITTRSSEISLEDLVTSDAEDASALSKWGFTNPPEALRRLRMIARGPSNDAITTEPQRRFVQLLPELLECIARSSDPDTGLVGLQRIAEATGSPLSFFRSIGSSKTALAVFSRLAASSPFLVRTLVSHPEYLDVISQAESLSRGRTLSSLVTSLRQRVAAEHTEEGWLNALRRFRSLEMLRIGVRDVAGLAPVTSTTRQISLLAEACVRVAYQGAVEKASRGDGLPGRLAVFGLGKLGGREMHYYSDLDLVCVYQQKPGDADGFRIFERTVRSIINALSRQTSEGRAFQVDLRLRPEGNAGVVVMPAEGYRKYLSDQVAAWERQALVRARLVAGSSALGADISDAVVQCVWGRPLSAEDLETLRHIKRRIENEKSGSTEGWIDLKRGPGGIVDIEFTVQMLQLAFGAEVESIRSPSTVSALKAVLSTGVMAEADARTLLKAYLFMRKAENRLQMSSENPVEGLAAEPEQSGMLAKRMGYAGSQVQASEHLLDDYHRLAAAARKIHETVFFETDLTREACGAPRSVIPAIGAKSAK